MNTEFFEALTLLEKEKGIPAEYLLEKIKAAIAIAVKRDYGGSENGLVEIDPEKGKFQVAIRKTVVEEVENPNTEILLNDAYKYDKKAQIGSVVDIPLETKQFGRIAAQAAKHVIRQGIREAERGQMMQEFQSREHEIISAKVVRTDPVRGSVTLEIGKSEAMLTRQEQGPGEELAGRVGLLEGASGRNAEERDNGHRCGGAVERAEAAGEREALHLHYLLRSLRFGFRLAQRLEDALVEVLAESLLGLLFFIYEQALVASQPFRQTVLAEERLQDLFLLERCLAGPEAFQELFNILIVHSYPVFRNGFAGPSGRGVASP